MLTLLLEWDLHIWFKGLKQNSEIASRTFERVIKPEKLNITHFLFEKFIFGEKREKVCKGKLNPKGVVLSH